MDNFETESNSSYHSESLQSNASTVSGLSLYGNEFAELRHLVNPLKYPQPYLEQHVTPKVELFTGNEDDKVTWKLELKFHDQINKLLSANSRLEGELENANNQIERLIKGYKEQHNHKAFKEKIDLEKKLHQLSSDYSTLQTKCAKLQQGKTEIDLVNKNLKINLEELLVERDIKNSSIQSLKQKVSEQHIEILEFIKSNSHLNEKLDLASSKLTEAEKSKLWYKEQLSICQNDKVKLTEELNRCRNQINNDNEKLLSFNIELSKYKNEVDKVRLQALKEKEALLKKLDSINLDRSNLITNRHTFDTQFYEQTTEEDLQEEALSKLNKLILNKSDEIEKLNHENANVISKCIVLQSTLKQKEDSIHLLEVSRKELLQNLDCLKENQQLKVSEIVQLKNRLAELEVELNFRNKEKDVVENSIQLIREQFLKVKESYENVKTELNSKNKEIIKLQLEKQELFMNNSRIICELDGYKHKSSLMENLRQENLSLIEKARLVELEMLKKDETIREKEFIVSDCSSKLTNLHGKLNEVSKDYSDLHNAFDHAKLQIDSQNSKINEMLKTIEALETISSEKQVLSASHTALQQKYNTESTAKDKHIANLQSKLSRFETDWQNYLKRITDDQKVELLLRSRQVVDTTTNMQPFSTKNIENYITNFFDNLNIEEFEASVDVRLKYLDDRIRTINGNVHYLEKKVKNESGQNRIRELEVLLQVKDRELQDRQKKMDRNNRTLLRKVKEHMRGRNSAEKQLKYLQKLYETLADDKNAITLSLTSKEHEIRSSVDLCEAYKKEIERLRKSVVNLEQALAKAKVCENCREAGQIQDKLMHFEVLCEDLRLANGGLQEELNFVRGNLSLLQEKNEALEGKVKSLEQENCALNKENSASNEKLRNLEGNISTLENKLFEKENLCCQQSVLIEKLKSDLTEAAKKTEFLSNEVEMHSSNLQQKVEYSRELEEDNAKYKKIISLLQNDIKLLKNEKYFLQRLSSDLKVALNTYTEYNKKLKQQLNLLAREQQTFSRLPANILNDISISGKYDENYINRLLSNNHSPSLGKLVTLEIQCCLNKLREEIFSLQDQISKKNAIGEIESEG